LPGTKTQTEYCRLVVLARSRCTARFAPQKVEAQDTDAGAQPSGGDQKQSSELPCAHQQGNSI
jgi:hypothetical protein